MSYYSPSIEKLIEAFEKLPSIGNKTAARLAFYMLDRSEEEVNEFVSSIINAKKKIYNIKMVIARYLGFLINSLKLLTIFFKSVNLSFITYSYFNIFPIKSSFLIPFK